MKKELISLDTISIFIFELARNKQTVFLLSTCINTDDTGVGGGNLQKTGKHVNDISVIGLILKHLCMWSIKEQ